MLAAFATSDPFALWDAARRQLDDAIQLYLDTSIALAAAVSQNSSPFPNKKLFESAVNIIFGDSQTSITRYHKSARAHSHLCKIQNRSSGLVPFHKLPLEIIARIFHFAAGRSCACDSVLDTLDSGSAQYYGPNTLLTLTHVCTYWRDIAIGTPFLWSHVTFDLNRTEDFTKPDAPNCPQMWLERARNIPVYIHLNGTHHHASDFLISSSVGNHLLPYLNKITGFRIEVGWNYWILSWLFSLLLSAGGANSVQEFVHLDGINTWNKPLLLSPPAHRPHPVQSPFPFLRTVRLGDMCFSWDSVIYRNLVDLQLVELSADSSPTIEQLLGALSACPELRTLRLCQFGVQEQDDPHLIPVVLEALELLDIAYMWSETVSLLLPVLSSGRCELSVRVCCWYRETGDALKAITSFFSRSNVTRLFICGSGSPCVSEYMISLRGLRVLVLDFDSDRGDKNLEAITYLAHPDAGRRSPRCPSLQSLYLINGALENSTVQAAVEAHSLKRLTFGACFLDPFEVELVHWLKPMVENVTSVKQLNRIYLQIGSCI